MVRVDLVGWALLLIALAMSYSVLIKTEKTDNKNLKMLGYVISVIILIAVLILAISDLGLRIRMRRGVTTSPMQRRIGSMNIPARPNINIPAIPRAPKAVPEKAPLMPVVPTPPAVPNVQ